MMKLGTALKCVDVMFDVPGGGMLLVEGEPSKDLVRMHLHCAVSACRNPFTSCYKQNSNSPWFALCIGPLMAQVTKNL